MGTKCIYDCLVWLGKVKKFLIKNDIKEFTHKLLEENDLGNIKKYIKQAAKAFFVEAVNICSNRTKVWIINEEEIKRSNKAKAYFGELI